MIDFACDDPPKIHNQSFGIINWYVLCLWHRYSNGQESEPYEADNSVLGPLFKIYYLNLKGPNKHLNIKTGLEKCNPIIKQKTFIRKIAWMGDI